MDDCLCPDVNCEWCGREVVECEAYMVEASDLAWCSAVCYNARQGWDD